MDSEHIDGLSEPRESSRIDEPGELDLLLHEMPQAIYNDKQSVNRAYDLLDHAQFELAVAKARIDRLILDEEIIARESLTNDKARKAYLQHEMATDTDYLVAVDSVTLCQERLREAEDFLERTQNQFRVLRLRYAAAHNISHIP
jgi:hypothetical protein